MCAVCTERHALLIAAVSSCFTQCPSFIFAESLAYPFLSSLLNVKRWLRIKSLLLMYLPSPTPVLPIATPLHVTNPSASSNDDIIVVDAAMSFAASTHPSPSLSTSTLGFIPTGYIRALAITVGPNTEPGRPSVAVGRIASAHMRIAIPPRLWVLASAAAMGIT